MKKIKIYQIDAFAERLFSGNPAAVVILDDWLDDNIMQSIAAENNLAETAFVVSGGNSYNIRWFTPTVEVDLCGHATLASAFVLFNFYDKKKSDLVFNSLKSGELRVTKEGKKLFLDFPADKLKVSNDHMLIEDCIGIIPLSRLKGKKQEYSVKNRDVRSIFLCQGQ